MKCHEDQCRPSNSFVYLVTIDVTIPIGFMYGLYYIHLWLIFDGELVGKYIYTVHGCYGLYSMFQFLFFSGWVASWNEIKVSLSGMSGLDFYC